MTDAQKLADYDRIIEIIEDQVALEKHQIEQDGNFDGMQFSRADAYRHIVVAVKGIDIG
jgi:hypothetical protein